MENKHNVRVCFKVPTNSRYQKKNTKRLFGMVFPNQPKSILEC